MACWAASSERGEGGVLKRKLQRKSYKIRLLPNDKVSLYGVQCGLFVKIGIAANIERRIIEFEVGNPYPMKVIMDRKINAAFAAEAEHLAHKMLASAHHRGEWFLTTRQEARRVINLAVTQATRRANSSGTMLREMDLAQQDADAAEQQWEDIRQKFLARKSVQDTET